MLLMVADVGAAGEGAGCAQSCVAQMQIDAQPRAMRNRAVIEVVLLMRASSIVTLKLIHACDLWLAGRGGSARGWLLE